MMKWFGRLFERFFKSDNVVIKLLRLCTMGALSALWAMVAIVFPLSKINFLLLFPVMTPLCVLVVFAISGAVTFAWLFGWIRIRKLFECYERSSLPPSDNDHQGGQKYLTAAMAEVEDILLPLEKQFEKAGIYLKRILYESRLLFSNPKPRLCKARLFVNF